MRNDLPVGAAEILVVGETPTNARQASSGSTFVQRWLQ